MYHTFALFDLTQKMTPDRSKEKASVRKTAHIPDSFKAIYRVVSGC